MVLATSQVCLVQPQCSLPALSISCTRIHITQQPLLNKNIAAINTINTTSNTASGAKVCSAVKVEMEVLASDWLDIFSSLEGIHMQKSLVRLAASLFVVSAA